MRKRNFFMACCLAILFGIGVVTIPSIVLADNPHEPGDQGNPHCPSHPTGDPHECSNVCRPGAAIPVCKGGGGKPG